MSWFPWSFFLLFLFCLGGVFASGKGPNRRLSDQSRTRSERTMTATPPAENVRALSDPHTQILAQKIADARIVTQELLEQTGCPENLKLLFAALSSALDMPQDFVGAEFSARGDRFAELIRQVREERILRKARESELQKELTAVRSDSEQVRGELRQAQATIKQHAARITQLSELLAEYLENLESDKEEKAAVAAERVEAREREKKLMGEHAALQEESKKLEALVHALREESAAHKLACDQARAQVKELVIQSADSSDQSALPEPVVMQESLSVSSNTEILTLPKKTPDVLPVDEEVSVLGRKSQSSECQLVVEKTPQSSRATTEASRAPRLLRDVGIACATVCALLILEWSICTIHNKYVSDPESRWVSYLERLLSYRKK